MQPKNYLKEVKGQYEDYPYPYRNPNDEHNLMRGTSLDILDLVNFYCFGGKQKFSNFRILIAGGGTGDSVIFLGEQLRELDAEIVYLDLSQASMSIAKDRVKIRGLKNIKWVCGSILDLKEIDLGEFDYINCSGVLHHLKDPVEGLSCLKSVLKEDGAMAIMVYGKYGRRAVYMMQDLVKKVVEGNLDDQQKVEVCKKLLASFAEDHPVAVYSKDSVDVNQYGDIGIYDLYLHSQDRAYTVPELYDWVEDSCGLKVIEFLQGDTLSTLAYDSIEFINESKILDRILKLEGKQRERISELLFYNSSKKHVFFLGKDYKETPSLDCKNYIPYYLPIASVMGFPDILTKSTERLKSIKIGEEFTFKTVFSRVAIKKTECLVGIIEALDGKRTLGEVMGYVCNKNPKLDKAKIKLEFEAFYNSLRAWNLII